MATDLFVITSVIHTGNAPWSYISTRSIFSPDERFQQTLETIRSIRMYCPGAKILLVEASVLSLEQTSQFESQCDYYVNVNSVLETRQYCLSSGKKGLGDAWLFLQGLEFIQKSSLAPRAIFKISGRYRLNEAFQRSAISDELPTFRQYSADGYVTFCFSIPGSMLETSIEIMKNTVAMYCTHENPCLETFLPAQFPEKKALAILGAEGTIAIDFSLSVYKV